MPLIQFRIAQPEEYQELAEWLYSISQTPEQHCLHTWSDQSTAEMQQQWLAYWNDGELYYLVARQNDQLVGALGCEYDLSLQRGWLHGPHASENAWTETANQLYTHLLNELPTAIQELNANLNIRNHRACHFYVQQGFQQVETLNHNLYLTAEQRVAAGDHGCLPLGKQHRESFIHLYNELFPRAYYSARRVIQMIGKSHQVWVLAQGEEVLGFSVVYVEPGASSGEIQFFGVREDYRRQGVGCLPPSTGCWMSPGWRWCA